MISSIVDYLVLRDVVVIAWYQICVSVPVAEGEDVGLVLFLQILTRLLGH